MQKRFFKILGNHFSESRLSGFPSLQRSITPCLALRTAPYIHAFFLYISVPSAVQAISIRTPMHSFYLGARECVNAASSILTHARYCLLQHYFSHLGLLSFDV